MAWTNTATCAPYAEAPDLYKESELGWIPKEWDAARVDEVGSVQLGRQRSPKHQSGRFTTPYLRVANVFDGWIDYSDILEMDFTPREKQTYSVLPGDIFLNEGQSLELVGRSAVYEGNPDHYCFQNTLVRFRAYEPNDHCFCQGIFKFWLDTGEFRLSHGRRHPLPTLAQIVSQQSRFPIPTPMSNDVYLPSFSGTIIELPLSKSTLTNSGQPKPPSCKTCSRAKSG